MLCDNCKEREATVHYKEIRDDKVIELHLCEVCAEKEGIISATWGISDMPPAITDFLAHLAEDLLFLPKEKEEVSKKCSFCGTSYADFTEKGRLGCSNCYQVFNKQLTQILRRIHGASSHVGKSPIKIEFAPSIDLEKDLLRLKEKLQIAIKNEEFEEAARLRDEIKKIEENLRKKSQSHEETG
jgi:protein arginine kinase activator